MEHEEHAPRAAKAGSSDRAFGLVFAAVFAIVGAWPLHKGATPHLWALVLGAYCALMAFAHPAVLAPLNRLWTRFGLLLHTIVSPLVLGVMFFLVVTPTGFVMRLMGKDLLKLRFDRQARTYWVNRAPPGPPPEGFKDQF